jgi:protein SCO1
MSGSWKNHLTLFPLLLALGTAAAAADTLPGDSLYQLPLPLETQERREAALAVHRGHPVVISMFYGSCPHVCPMLIARIQQLERGLPEASRPRLRVLMVSLDPARDTPGKLRDLAARHRADLARWTFARTGEGSVRKLAAALGIQYRQLPDGEFNHATVLTLLDREGRIVARTAMLKRDDEAFVNALRAATAAP